MNPITITDKWRAIEPYLAGKTVLDVGCCDQAGTLAHKRAVWLHERILKVAAGVIGVDINRPQVDALRAQGFTEIIYGDVETVDMGREFDAVFAGELIEHLSNPGWFLDNMHRHLKNDGYLIITTPNRFHAMPIIQAVLHHRLPDYHKDMPLHVCFFDINSLAALARRHKFYLENYWYLREKLPTLKAKVLLGTLLKWWPEFNANIVAVMRKV